MRVTFELSGADAATIIRIVETATISARAESGRRLAPHIKAKIAERAEDLSRLLSDLTSQAARQISSPSDVDGREDVR